MASGRPADRAEGPRCACDVSLADVNGHGRVDFGDINPFVLYLSNFAVWQTTYGGCQPQNGQRDAEGRIRAVGG